MSDVPNDEDEALVRAAMAGDGGAFDRLMEHHAPRIYRLIRAQVGDTCVAEDLLQETFLRAFVALPKFRFGARFLTWLYRIMVNTVKPHQRNSARRRELDGRPRPEAEPMMGTDAVLEGKEAREQVWRPLAELPEEFREVVLLREWDGLSYAEIAQVVGCQVGTVGSRIARARQMLAARLGPR